MPKARREAHRFGPAQSGRGELWLPDGVAAKHLPTVVLLHGGFWRPAYTKVLMRPLARALAGAGFAAWNVEYRRLGQLGGGGGWPATFSDVASSLSAVERLPSADPERVVVLGHSAGGLLAFWLAAGAPWPEGEPVPDLPVRAHGVVGLAPVLDLAAAATSGAGQGHVRRLLGGSPEERRGRYRVLSPVELLPLGVPQRIIHGGSDRLVPVHESQRYVDLASAEEDVRLDVLPGVGHRGLLLPRPRVLGPILRALGELTG